jgi:hypothetical protein
MEIENAKWTGGNTMLYSRKTKWLEDSKLWQSSCQAIVSLFFMLSDV